MSTAAASAIFLTLQAIFISPLFVVALRPSWAKPALWVLAVLALAAVASHLVWAFGALGAES